MCLNFFSREGRKKFLLRKFPCRNTLKCSTGEKLYRQHLSILGDYWEQVFRHHLGSIASLHFQANESGICNDCGL